MKGFVSNWGPEDQTGSIRACPQKQTYALLGIDNSGVAEQLNSIYPTGFDSKASCPPPADAVQVTFDPGPDETAENVIVVSQPAVSPLQLAQLASTHAFVATDHAKSLATVPGVKASILGAAHAAASAVASAIQRQSKDGASKLRGYRARPS